MPKTGDAPAGALLKYTSYLYKNPNLSDTEFHSHWRAHHARFPLAAMAKQGVVRYTQYHTSPSTRQLLAPMIAKRKLNPQSKLTFELVEYDAVVQIWFKDFKTWERVMREPMFAGRIFQDEEYLFDVSRAYTTLGWEEDMLVDGGIVMPGFTGLTTCECICGRCEKDCVQAKADMGQ